MKKRVLIIQFRPNDRASDNEYEALVGLGGLQVAETERIRLDKNPRIAIRPEHYDAVIMGGSPFNVSDVTAKKSDVQLAAESNVFGVMREIMERDIPCLGICYGLGILGTCCQTPVSTEKYGEEVGVTRIYLTDEGKKDPITRGIPPVFNAIVGHKEACQSLPEGTVLLAKSDACPTQLVRYKNNVYATQFHPELDDEGIKVRAHIYKNAGYYPATEVGNVIARTTGKDLTHPVKILRNFIEMYVR